MLPFYTKIDEQLMQFYLMPVNQC